MILARDELGTGTPVLLLHSGIADRRMWRDLVPALSRDHRVVAPDLRGFGDSPLPGEEFTDAGDLAALLDRSELDRVAVVGSSLGGRVALELASAHPDSVSSLLLLCPAHRGAARTPGVTAFAATEARLLEAGDLDAVVDLNVSTWLGPDASPGTRARLAEMHRHALDVQLAADQLTPRPRRVDVEVRPDGVAVPVVVVTGGQDMDHFQQVGRWLATEIRGAELVHLPWAGHLPSLERPDEVADLLLDVLLAAPPSRT